MELWQSAKPAEAAAKKAMEEAAEALQVASASPKDKPCPEENKLRKSTAEWGNLDAGAVFLFWLFVNSDSDIFISFWSDSFCEFDFVYSVIIEVLKYPLIGI